MNTYAACSIIEGFDGEEHSAEEIIEAFQSLIDSGACWVLQGFYGRTAAALIANGQCQRAKEAA